MSLSTVHGRCVRSWQVEAARDGRLSGSALDAACQHIERCPACRAEAARMQNLRVALRRLAEPAVDELAVRRLRQRTLERADAELAGRARRSGLRSWRVRALLACVAVIAIGVVVGPSVESWRKSAKTTVDAVAVGRASWTHEREGQVERIELSDGALQLRVRRAPGGRRVVVTVPDGEIEDRGTTFHVVVEHARTIQIGVDEGAVTVRLRDEPPFTLLSGATWERSQQVIPAHAPASFDTPKTNPQTPAIVPRKRRREPAPLEPKVESPPPDAAAQDASYVRAIELLRQGRNDDARAAARDYLRLFPDGFRRKEMGQIAQ